MVAAVGKVHLLSLDPEQLGEWLGAREQPAYRGGQILEWVYQRGATAFEQMTNLPKALREELDAAFSLYESTVQRRQESRDGTVKLLLRWGDGRTSECVMIPDEARRTACISSQVGCPVGCTFCASGIGGLERNLTAGQIVEQVLRVRGECGAEHRLSNVVYMGLGEPLANYRALIASLRTLRSPWGLNIGQRKITVSTVGLPRQMRSLADERMQITLALSLHAPSDALRAKLIPWAKKIPLAELIEAARYYFDTTGREVTLEYILLHGVNDKAEHARELVKVARKMRCNVNLIRYNPVSGMGFERPSASDAHFFVEELRKFGVNAHVRRSRGMDIDAACGQLRRKAQGTTAARVAAEED